jgi:hypothetical protein
MPIERADRVTTGADPGGHGATTPSGGTPRRSRLRSREGRDRPGGARCLATARGGARGARWCAFSAVLADLRARVRTAETKAADLEFALATNRRIGIAVGILMCRLRVTEDRAFAVLCKHSQDHNVKMRDLAEEVIYTGSL